MFGFGRKSRIIKETKEMLENKETVQCVVSTTMGDFTLELYPSKTPKTVVNFLVHSKNGYYDGIIFHRVIDNFMIQGGDPTGTGRGGKSIWGSTFEDEIVKDLTHEPGVISMANAGPGTNGSQFFVTLVACPWLNGKHTVFGKVVKGFNVVESIGKVKVDYNDKPINPVSIVSIKVEE